MILSQAFLASLFTGIGLLALFIVLLGLALVALYLLFAVLALAGTFILIILFITAAVGRYDPPR
jgi:hypothetical protein